MYFLTGLFCIHSSCKYLPIYFNIIIFRDIEVWYFEIYKNGKEREALVPICTKSRLVIKWLLLSLNISAPGHLVIVKFFSRPRYMRFFA
jgi:hypothetical protein